MNTRVLVAGLGNVLMSDDAIGPYCAQYLLAHYEFPPDVEVADLGTPGLDLTLHLAGADMVLIVDALRGASPGTIAAYDCAAVLAGRHGERLDTHSPAIEESILVARLSGPRPYDVRVIGLAGMSFDQGTALTPAIHARIPALGDAVLAELATLDVRWVPRATPQPVNAWWESRVAR